MKKRRLDATLVTLPAATAELDLWGLLRRASPALLVLGVWIAVHPFSGIVHDSRLYVVQALHALQPDVFDEDLFFAFGSQDEFTLFTPLFAPLVGWLGPLGAAMTVVIAGHVLWLTGAAALALRLASSVTGAVAALVLVAAVPSFYGGLHTLSFAEGFATPRLLAEGLSLWALWALTQNRIVTAAAIAVIGALLHPLVFATALSAGFLVLVFRDWRWALPGLAAIVAVAGAAYAGVAPFDRLAQTMDAEWLAVVERRNTYLFPTLWQARDWAALATALAAAFAGAAVLSGWRRQLILAAVFAGLGGLLATHLGADIWHNLFLIQVQPYRALWLLHVFAYLGAGLLLVRLWQSVSDGPSLVALIGLSLLTAQTLHPVSGAILSCVSFALAVLRLRGALPPLPSIARSAIYVSAGMLLVFLVVARIHNLAVRMVAAPRPGEVLDSYNLVSVIEVAAAAVIAVGLVRAFPRAARTVLPLAALALVVVATSTWDRRGAWSRTLTEFYPVAALEAHLAPDAQVFWEDEVRGAWLLLRRPSYISPTQGAGIAFNRGTALTFRDRAAIMQPLAHGAMVDVFDPTLEAPLALPPLALGDLALPRLALGDLVETCRRAPGLDAMVLSRAVPGAYAAEWRVPTPIYDTAAAVKRVVRPPVHRVYLYRCTDLR